MVAPASLASLVTRPAMPSPAPSSRRKHQPHTLTYTGGASTGPDGQPWQINMREALKLLPVFDYATGTCDGCMESPHLLCAACGEYAPYILPAIDPNNQQTRHALTFCARCYAVLCAVRNPRRRDYDTPLYRERPGAPLRPAPEAEAAPEAADASPSPDASCSPDASEPRQDALRGAQKPENQRDRCLMVSHTQTALTPAQAQEGRYTPRAYRGYRQGELFTDSQPDATGEGGAA